MRTGRRTMRAISILSAMAATAALVLAACGGGKPATASPSAASPGADAAASARERADARIRFLEQRAAGDPLDTFSLNSLAIEHLQRARETGDVSELSRAADALDRSLAVGATDNYDAVALSASLAATRHDFARGADLARQAIAMKPNGAYGYGALGDALMGLGDYAGARQAYDRMLALSPDTSSYSREALLAAATGGLDAAAQWWQRALDATAGDDVPEHAAWVRSQIGTFDFYLRGDLEAARGEYQAALDAFPGYVHALAGLGRVAAAEGDYDAAAGWYTRAIDTVPLPEYVIALGDVYTAAGEDARAQDEYDLVEAIRQLYRANGVNLDLQIALFDADRGRDLQANVARAEALYASQPSLQAADALAWARYAAGDIAGAREASDRALASGTRDPLVLYHAAMIARAAGDVAGAEARLEAIEAQAPRFSVRYADAARTALDDLRAEARR